MDLSSFEKKIGVAFKDKALLKQAFTHRSYINEHKGSKLGHNERLEFLGDAVLELIVTEYLFEKYPDQNEGEMTSFRSALVNANTLSRIAKDLGVNDHLLLSHGESRDVGRARLSILADTFEAIVGAIFIDSGFEVTQKFITKNVLSLAKEVVEEGLWMDSKSIFQEKAQEVFGITPIYKSLKEEGPDHDKQFTVGVFIGADIISSGTGKSKQDAEQDAAANGLKEKDWK